MIEALAKLADKNGLRAVDIVEKCETSEWAWELLEDAGLEDAGLEEARKADRLNQEKMTKLMEKVG